MQYILHTIICSPYNNTCFKFHPVLHVFSKKKVISLVNNLCVTTILLTDMHNKEKKIGPIIPQNHMFALSRLAVKLHVALLWVLYGGCTILVARVK